MAIWQGPGAYSPDRLRDGRSSLLITGGRFGKADRIAAPEWLDRAHRNNTPPASGPGEHQPPFGFCTFGSPKSRLAMAGQRIGNKINDQTRLKTIRLSRRGNRTAPWLDVNSARANPAEQGKAWGGDEHAKAVRIRQRHDSFFGAMNRDKFKNVKFTPGHKGVVRNATKTGEEPRPKFVLVKKEEIIEPSEYRDPDWRKEEAIMALHRKQMREQREISDALDQLAAFEDARNRPASAASTDSEDLV